MNFLQDKQLSEGKLWKYGKTYGLTHLYDDKQILEEFCPFTKEERQTILYLCNLYDVNLKQAPLHFGGEISFISFEYVMEVIFNLAIKNVASKLNNICQYLEAEPIFGKGQRKLTRVREFIQDLYIFVKAVISSKNSINIDGIKKFFQPKKYDTHNQSGFLTLVGQDLLNYILRHFFDIRKELILIIHNYKHIINL